MPTPKVEAVNLGDLKCWRIDDGRAELLVTEQGAQVVSYRRHGEQPLIWLNDHALFKPGTPIRGGVPVCWPWFGNLAKNPDTVQAMRQADDTAPAHGLVRAVNWVLEGIDSSAGPVRATFTLPQANGQLPGWPHQAELRLTIELGDDLFIDLTTRNLGQQPITLSQALHTYFAVSDVRQISVDEVAGLEYIETLENWETRTQQGALEVAGETDRIYLATPQRLAINDHEWKRRVLIDTHGSASAVIWNPWIERAAAFVDMADDGWQHMFCIETANVLGDVVALAPGERHSLGYRLSTEAL
ncbi:MULTISPECIES: D-hexose-6-phosphate mutarotase [unclassified Pseudomonas]|uniref:D-hexose-6-phosphate mutarotase n=1 Tax=unclassified Pseudomonas TaxID=196821 RepID=UPI000BC3A3D3|nr:MULTISPECIES: D-hexose-6-phosphate mutarotase [unclassified Pseudomonas]PVZ10469.1 glucose-6-phosphate 1-epimerase [Pseudomonas sp. URIL14HWK12:I12]PVZ21895.1 glucose-6-phosphate 1-epimerase [Pseudomonas sp. URIL14HWK12:I10]PVZ31022.1 glucose-6-phosphate 1-epimerase [Pseudomonas sp. URIL14HWK12:I11]SNZ17562.1 glucose-6-phosphate 1-epimerase [Pseudomonas sp. URIL14HWK12:I9]